MLCPFILSRLIMSTLEGEKNSFGISPVLRDSLEIIRVVNDHIQSSFKFPET